MGMLDSFAVVHYLNAGLADFVDHLRCEFSPGCPHRAHITILPPRPLSIPVSEAIRKAEQIVTRVEPFYVQLGDVGHFDATNVIKLNVVEGNMELRTLHDVLNTGALEFPEAYEYVPHVTLCMDSPVEKAQEFLEEARRKWACCPDLNRFVVDCLTFVQQQDDGVWRDLANLPLGARQPVRVRAWRR